MENEKVITVLRGQPSWQPLVAKTIVGIALFLLILAIYTAVDASENISPTRSFFISFEIILLVSVVGLALLIRRTTTLDLGNNRYKNEFNLGWIKRGEWLNLPRLDYVAVFSNEPEHFDVNLWYDRNKHITMFVCKDKHRAFDIACKIAIEQEIRLLDATVRKNKHYVNLAELSEKYGYDSPQKTS